VILLFSSQLKISKTQSFPSAMTSLFLFLNKWKNLVLLFFLFLLANFLLSKFMPREHALDLKFAYSVDQAYLALKQLTTQEQNQYKFGISVLDMPYLIIYGLFFSGILLKLWKNKWIVLIPVSISLMDFFENLLVIGVINLLPDKSPMLVTFASLFTTSKWILIGVLVVAILAGFILFLFRRPKIKSFTEKTKI